MGAQQLGVEADGGQRLLEAQVLAEHAGVLGRMVGPRVGEAHLVQHEAPPDQPAQQAVGQHQKGLVGEAAVGRVGDAVVQAQLGPRALHHQLARHLVQEDREAAQDALDGALHRRAGDDGLAHQGIAAHLHAAAVQAEELVVQRPAHRQPQAEKAEAGTRAWAMPSHSAGCRRRPGPAAGPAAAAWPPPHGRSTSRPCPSR
jgi:hypothetical protein